MFSPLTLPTVPVPLAPGKCDQQCVSSELSGPGLINHQDLALGRFQNAHCLDLRLHRFRVGSGRFREAPQASCGQFRRAHWRQALHPLGKCFPAAWPMYCPEKSPGPGTSNTPANCVLPGLWSRISQREKPDTKQPNEPRACCLDHDATDGVEAQQLQNLQGQNLPCRAEVPTKQA